jgi:hypothetical protein
LRCGIFQSFLVVIVSTRYGWRKFSNKTDDEWSVTVYGVIG